MDDRTSICSTTTSDGKIIIDCFFLFYQLLSYWAHGKQSLVGLIKYLVKHERIRILVEITRILFKLTGFYLT